MRKFRLEGYNSGGYHDFREVEFDGELELVHTYDVESGLTEYYVKVTNSDGTVRKENNAFLQRLLDEQSWIESFLTIAIEEIPFSPQLEEKKRKKT